VKPSSPPDTISIVAPCFNEGRAVIAFLERLTGVLKGLPGTFHIVIVDDCSQDDSLQQLAAFRSPSAGIKFTALGLKFNLGQQGAIYQGLLYAAGQDSSHVIVMDCDGEDDPAAIPLLLEHKNYQVVRVCRGRRSERLSFRILYFWYRVVFKFITGKKIDFGNYCMINRDVLERIRHTSFVHFPAYLLRQKASMASIRHDRGKRIDGRSKMGFNGLFLHAFKSMIEFAEDLLLLFFRLFIINMVLFTVLLLNIVYQKFIAHTAILGWFSTLAVSLIILAALSIGFFITGVLLLNLIHQQNSKSYRQIYTAIPGYDYKRETETVS
jgi:polyisoprenyl-phosphate glycosyltransferase